MLMTAVHEAGNDRVYVTRVASVVCYFARIADDGMELRVEPGLAVYPPEFERNREGVKEAALHMAAGKLGVAVGDVLAQSFKALQALADPPLPDHYRFARRQNRSKHAR